MAAQRKAKSTSSTLQKNVSKTSALSPVSDDIRLQLKYPNMYVALADRANSKKRRVLAVAASLADLHRRIADLPAAARTQLCIEYLPDPKGPLALPGHVVGA